MPFLCTAGALLVASQSGNALQPYCQFLQVQTCAGEDAVGAAGVVEHGDGRVEAERAVRVGAVGRARAVRVAVHNRRQVLCWPRHTRTTISDVQHTLAM